MGGNSSFQFFQSHLLAKFRVWFNAVNGSMSVLVVFFALTFQFRFFTLQQLSLLGHTIGFSYYNTGWVFEHAYILYKKAVFQINILFLYMQAKLYFSDL